MQLYEKTVNYQISTLDYYSSLHMAMESSEIVEHRKIIFNIDSRLKVQSGAFWPAQAAAGMAKETFLRYGNGATPIVLCVSGGLDSQAMLYAFLASGVKFQVAVMRFKDGLNEHDIGHAVSLLSQLGIAPQIHELDIRNFYESGEFEKYALIGSTSSPQFAAHVWLADKIQGVPVFAGEPWHTTVSADKQKTKIYIPQHKEYGTEIALAKAGRVAISHFFETSAAWLQALLEVSDFRYRYRDDSDPIGSYKAKFLFYRSLGFPVSLPAGLVKLTGFERLYSLIATEKNIENFYHFNELYRLPLEKRFPVAQKRVFQIEGLSGGFWTELSDSSLNKTR